MHIGDAISSFKKVDKFVHLYPDTYHRFLSKSL